MELLHVFQLVEEIDGFGRRQIIARELGNQLVLTNQMLFTCLTWPFTMSMSSSRAIHKNAAVRCSFRPSWWTGFDGWLQPI
jgi:hypothetical protein